MIDSIFVAIQDLVVVGQSTRFNCSPCVLTSPISMASPESIRDQWSVLENCIGRCCARCVSSFLAHREDLVCLSNFQRTLTVCAFQYVWVKTTYSASPLPLVGCVSSTRIIAQAFTKCVPHCIHLQLLFTHHPVNLLSGTYFFQLLEMFFLPKHEHRICRSACLSDSSRCSHHRRHHSPYVWDDKALSRREYKDHLSNNTFTRR